MRYYKHYFRDARLDMYSLVLAHDNDETATAYGEDYARLKTMEHVRTKPLTIESGENLPDNFGVLVFHAKNGDVQET